MISQWFPPHISGGSIRTFNAAKGLTLIGHKVTVITPFSPPPFVNYDKDNRKRIMTWSYVSGIRVIKTWSPFLQDLGLVRRSILFLCFMISSLFPLILINHVDIVWAVNPPIFSIFPALIYKVLNRSKLLRDVPDLWPEVIDDLGLIKNSVIKSILKLGSKISYLVSDGVTSISAGYLPILKRKYGLADDKIHIIEVGVDVDYLYPSVKKNMNLSKHGTKNKFIIMYSGNLGVQYDFDTVINAAKLLNKYNDILFIIRGWGLLKNYIQKKIKNFNNIVLHTEIVDKKTICSILNSADIFLLPMKPLNASEMGLPTKLFEYQACRKPIIVSSRGEPARYVLSTDSGIVVPPNDPKFLSEAILVLHKNKKKRELLGDNGWKHVSNYLSCNKIGERLSNVFEIVLKKNARAK